MDELYPAPVGPGTQGAGNKPQGVLHIIRLFRRRGGCYSVEDLVPPRFSFFVWTLHRREVRIEDVKHCGIPSK